MKKPRGGARPGAGRKAGGKNAATVVREVEKAVLREHVRRRVAAELDPMLDSQIANARGISHFFLRDPKTGQFVKIEDAQKIQDALNSGDEGSYYWIFTKDPSAQSWTDLANRAMDKPAEQEQSVEHHGELVIRWQ